MRLSGVSQCFSSPVVSRIVIISDTQQMAAVRRGAPTTIANAIRSAFMDLIIRRILELASEGRMLGSSPGRPGPYSSVNHCIPYGEVAYRGNSLLSRVDADNGRPVYPTLE